MPTTVATFSAFQNVNDGGNYTWTTPNNAANSDNAYAIGGSGSLWGGSPAKTTQLLRTNSTPAWSNGFPDGSINSITFNIEASENVSTAIDLYVLELGLYSDSNATRYTTAPAQLLTATDTGYNLTFTVGSIVAADFLSGNLYFDIKCGMNTTSGSSGSGTGQGIRVDRITITVDATSTTNPTHVDVDAPAIIIISGLGQSFNGDTGAVSPGTVATFGGTTPWSTPSNAASSNNSYATMTASQTEANNAFLRATNFGFDIPDTATILGVTVEIERHRSGGSSGQIRDDVVQLLTGPESLGSPTDTGWIVPTIWETVDFGGDWTSLANVTAEDGSVASGTDSSGLDDLWFSGFDFASLIPANSRLNGVQVQIKIRAVGGTESPSLADLYLAWGQGLNSDYFTQNVNNQNLTGTLTNYTFGSSSDPLSWGKLDASGVTDLGSMTMGDIRLDDFGVYVAPTGGGDHGTYEIDYLAVKVHFTPGAAEDGGSLSDPANWGTGTNVYATYGGSTSLWNATLTPAIINSSDFGVQLRVDNTGNRVANADHIRITVDYSISEEDVEVVTSVVSSSSALFWAFP
jgi:hypothetical protein